MGTSVEQLRTKAKGFIIQDIAIINWQVVAEKKGHQAGYIGARIIRAAPNPEKEN